MWITNGGFADLFTIFAKVDGDKFTAFLVERGMGVVSGRDEIKLGLDGSSTTALMLDNVKVPVENVLGTIGQGHKVAFNVLNFGRVKLGARNMSGVKLALNHAVRYAKERRQFGKAIAEFGLIKQKLAGMAIRGFVGDAMSYRTLGDVDRAIDGGDRADGAARHEDDRGLRRRMLHQQGVDERSARLGRRRGGAGVRRQRLLARVPAGADVPRRAHHAHLRGHQRDQPDADSRPAAQAVARGVHRRRGASGAGQSASAGRFAAARVVCRARQAAGVACSGPRRLHTATS